MSEAGLHGVLSSFVWGSNDLLQRIQSGSSIGSIINANRIACSFAFPKA